MVVEPAATAVARPEAFTVATARFELDHVAVVVRFWVLRSEYVPVAVNCWVCPAVTAGVWGVNAIEVRTLTTKLTPLLATPDTVTTTLPLVAPLGTVVEIEVVPQPVAVAVVPLNFTVLVPWVDPKFVPVIVIAVPTVPEVADSIVMLGVGSTVNALPLLFTPLAKTTTLPLVAPDGTVTAIVVAFQLVTVASVPLNLTVPEPWLAPKFVPVNVTGAPAGPLAVDRLVILGADTTVKLLPLLFTPLAKTMTLPVAAPLGTVTAIVVAFQLVTVAVVPLNLTVPDPWVAPKLVPVTVTAAPTAPVVTDRLEIFGAETTVKLFPLLATLDTVTTTFPVVAPVGTVTTMLVALQLVTDAVVPLNLTVLVPWVEPKFVPAIVTDAPTAPVAGDRLVIVGAAARTGAANGNSNANRHTNTTGQTSFRICLSPRAVRRMDKKFHFWVVRTEGVIAWI
jgi:hypothetical protein